jgi:hypothetical protein
MLSAQAIRILHVGAVSTIAAIAVFSIGTRLRLLFDGFGYEPTTAFRVLGLSYPCAFAFPVLAIGVALLSVETSRWARFVVPGTYLVSAAILGGLVFALYAPVEIMAR